MTDALGCTKVETINVDSLNPIADFMILSNELTNLEGTEPVNVVLVNQSLYFANPNNPLADTTFFWNLNYDNTNWYITHDYNDQPDTTYMGEEVYQICLVAINKNGCTDTSCQSIIVHKAPELETPNVFYSRNGRIK